jgi:hypothetical protein
LQAAKLFLLLEKDPMSSGVFGFLEVAKSNADMGWAKLVGQIAQAYGE